MGVSCFGSGSNSDIIRSVYAGCIDTAACDILIRVSGRRPQSGDGQSGYRAG
jgi:hypothetical protein